MNKYTHRGSPRSLTKSIKDNCPELSFTVFMRALKDKDVKINGTRTKENVTVSDGDVIEIYPKQPSKKYDFIENIIYSDDEVIVIDKPQGIETTQAEKLLADKFGACFAVHRLDRNTCGLNIFARTEKAKAALEDAFKNNYVAKSYIAEVAGKVEPPERLLTAYLKKDSKTSTVEISPVPKKDYVKIMTGYKVLKSQNNCSMLEISLLTGKTHQIRAHLSFIGHPVIGDCKYGSPDVNKAFSKTRQQLKSYKLSFSFPDTSPLNYLNSKIFELDKRI